MKPTLLYASWFLSAMAVLQVVGQFPPGPSPQDLPCTGLDCECQDLFKDCFPPLNLEPLQICSGSADYSVVNSSIDALATFCQSECAMNYTACLENSPNSDCTRVWLRQQALCSYDGGELCWSRFVQGVQEQSVNCSSGLCSVNDSLSCTSECMDELNSTSIYLGCCATSLFSECPVNVTAGTMVETYELCNVPLEPSCSTPSSTVFGSQSPSMTPTASTEIRTFTSMPIVTSTTSTSATPSGCCQLSGAVAILLVLLLACVALNQ